MLHLITERELSASSINLAIHALRAFYGGLLEREIGSLLKDIRRPGRKPQPPRVFGAEEIERLITVGTANDPLGRSFLMTLFSCGSRFSA